MKIGNDRIVQEILTKKNMILPRIYFVSFVTRRRIHAIYNNIHRFRCFPANNNNNKNTIILL